MIVSILQPVVPPEAVVLPNETKHESTRQLLG